MEKDYSWRSRHEKENIELANTVAKFMNKTTGSIFVENQAGGSDDLKSFIFMDNSIENSEIEHGLGKSVHASVIEIYASRTLNSVECVRATAVINPFKLVD